MSGLSIGDLSQTFQLRRDSARLKADLQRLTQELASGRESDLRTRFQGDLRPLASLERDLSRNDAFRLATQEAGLFLTAAQTGLESVQTASEDLLSSLLISPSLASSSQIDALAAQAGQSFASAVRSLNEQVAGRSIFAGIETTGPALSDPEPILADLAADVAAAGAATAAEVEAVLDIWFAPGGDFDTVAFAGSTSPLAPFRVSPEDEVAFGVTAADPALRDVLKGIAMAALMDRGVLSGDPDERGRLAARAGEVILAAKDDLVGLRGRVGSAEQAADSVSVKLAAQRSALEIARNGLVEADPFQAATDLAAVEAQLQTLYAVTARLSGLTLSNFLR